MKGTLHQKAFELLKGCDKPLPDIAQESELPYYWLKKFSADGVKDPSVNRVQKLYEYLTKKPLEI
jgi:hypothetical protein